MQISVRFGGRAAAYVALLRAVFTRSLAFVLALSLCSCAQGAERAEKFDLRQYLLGRAGTSVRATEHAYILQSKLRTAPDADTCYELACLNYLGIGVNSDLAEANRLWLESAKMGDADADFCLAILAAKGEGVPKNQVEACKFLLLAQDNTSGASILASRMLDKMEPSALDDALKSAASWRAQYRIAKKSED